MKETASGCNKIFSLQQEKRYHVGLDGLEGIILVGDLPGLKGRQVLVPDAVDDLLTTDLGAREGRVPQLHAEVPGGDVNLSLAHCPWPTGGRIGWQREEVLPWTQANHHYRDKIFRSTWFSFTFAFFFFFFWFFFWFSDLS